MVRSLETLLRARLTAQVELTELIAIYADSPAIFLQEAPMDTDESWQGAKYPQVVFSIEKFADAERTEEGKLSIDVVCAETSAQPEDIEPIIRKGLTGVFFTVGSKVFSIKWKDSQVFKETQEERNNILLGVTVGFDILAYPYMETSDPDPIAALAKFAVNWNEALYVIGYSELPEIFIPTRHSPALYFRTTKKGILEQTSSVIWIEAVLAVHFFAPCLGDQMEWVEQFMQSLAYAGEITMLDGSPMFLLNVQSLAGSDEGRGQISITVRYGLSRRSTYTHPLTRSHLRWR